MMTSYTWCDGEFLWPRFCLTLRLFQGTREEYAPAIGAFGNQNVDRLSIGLLNGDCTKNNYQHFSMAAKEVESLSLLGYSTPTHLKVSSNFR